MRQKSKGYVAGLALVALLAASCGETVDQSAVPTSSDAAAEPADDATPESSDTPSTDPVSAPASTAAVTQQDLVETITLSGTLGYGEVISLPTNSTGIVTAIPEEGDIVDFGEVVFELNGRPIPLLEGDSPQWRPFDINTLDGPDIQQLEASLIDLGYADENRVTVDDDLTSNSLDAIEEMWDALLDEDPDDDEVESFDIRSIELGEVIFWPTPIRVAKRAVTVGTNLTPAMAPFEVTGSEQLITIDADPKDRSLLEEGTQVTVELPDGEQVDGTISDVSDVATRSADPATGQQGDPTISVEVLMDDSTAGTYDAAPVDVIVVESKVEDALTVPASALIALGEGGHAVELVTESGTDLVAVETGTYADGRVEVIGDLEDGDTVVVPA